MSTRRHGEYAFDHGAQYFTVRDARFNETVEKLILAGVVEVWASTIAVIEGVRSVGLAESVTRYVGTPGMNAVVGSLASDMDVRFGTRVEGLRRENDHWIVSGDGGRLIGEYDIVLVSVPPAQALELLDPGVRTLGRVGSIRMNPCWAVMAAFEKPLSLIFEAAMIREASLSWVSRNGSKPGRSDAECWVLHASAEWSTRHIDSGSDDVSSSLLEALSKATSTRIPEPALVLAHRWRYARANRALGIDSLWDPHMALGICGDWCLGTRVEAAYLSGLSLAERVIGPG
jgi:predicted NAD/FAD-dependent oxidoreductase